MAETPVHLRVMTDLIDMLQIEEDGEGLRLYDPHAGSI